jgi:hypothetical protein
MTTKRATKKTFRCTCSKRKSKRGTDGNQRLHCNDFSDILQSSKSKGDLKASIVD